MRLSDFLKEPNFKNIIFTRTKVLCQVVFVYYLVTWFTGCPFRFFLGISCPGCGMTRAILAALHLDFSAAFAYHPLFFLMPFFLLAYYLDPWIDWSRHTLLLTFTVLLFIVVYLIRLLYLHDPMIIWHPADGVFFRSVFSLIRQL